MAAKTQNLQVERGATFRWPFYWYSDEKVVVPITVVALAYPVVLTAAAHGLPDSAVPARILGVADWLNTSAIDADDRRHVTKVDSDTCSLDMSGIDQDAYDGAGGVLVFNEPMELAAGWDAKLQVREAFDSEGVILELTSNDGEVELDNDGRVEPVFTDEMTEALEVGTYVYDLRLTNTGAGEDEFIARGQFKVLPTSTREA